MSLAVHSEQDGRRMVSVVLVEGERFKAHPCEVQAMCNDISSREAVEHHAYWASRLWC
jgi:hypothetical protein